MEVKMDVTEELKAAITTTQARHAIYKDGYARQISIFMALFPTGLKVQSMEDWRRLWALFMLTIKFTRYAVSLEEGKPHLDSVHDLGIYAFIAEKMEKEEGAQPGPLRHRDPIAQAMMNIADPRAITMSGEARRQARLALGLYLQHEAISQMEEGAFKTWLDAHRIAVLDEGPLSSQEAYPSYLEPCKRYRGSITDINGCIDCGWSYSSHVQP